MYIHSTYAERSWKKVASLHPDCAGGCARPELSAAEGDFEELADDTADAMSESVGTAGAHKLYDTK